MDFDDSPSASSSGDDDLLLPGVGLNNSTSFNDEILQQHSLRPLRQQLHDDKMHVDSSRLHNELQGDSFFSHVAVTDERELSWENDLRTMKSGEGYHPPIIINREARNKNYWPQEHLSSAKNVVPMGQKTASNTLSSVLDPEKLRGGHSEDIITPCRTVTETGGTPQMLTHTSTHQLLSHSFEGMPADSLKYGCNIIDQQHGFQRASSSSSPHSSVFVDESTVVASTKPSPHLKKGAFPSLGRLPLDGIVSCEDEPVEKRQVRGGGELRGPPGIFLSLKGLSDHEIPISNKDETEEPVRHKRGKQNEAAYPVSRQFRKEMEEYSQMDRKRKAFPFEDVRKERDDDYRLPLTQQDEESWNEEKEWKARFVDDCIDVSDEEEVREENMFREDYRYIPANLEKEKQELGMSAVMWKDSLREINEQGTPSAIYSDKSSLEKDLSFTDNEKWEKKEQQHMFEEEDECLDSTEWDLRLNGNDSLTNISTCVDCTVHSSVYIINKRAEDVEESESMNLTAVRGVGQDHGHQKGETVAVLKVLNPPTFLLNAALREKAKEEKMVNNDVESLSKTKRLFQALHKRREKAADWEGRLKHGRNFSLCLSSREEKQRSPKNNIHVDVNAPVEPKIFATLSFLQKRPSIDNAGRIITQTAPLSYASISLLDVAIFTRPEQGYRNDSIDHSVGGITCGYSGRGAQLFCNEIITLLRVVTLAAIKCLVQKKDSKKQADNNNNNNNIGDVISSSSTQASLIHGNLSASNIFLCPTGDGVSVTVLLCDPLQGCISPMTVTDCSHYSLTHLHYIEENLVGPAAREGTGESSGNISVLPLPSPKMATSSYSILTLEEDVYLRYEEEPYVPSYVDDVSALGALAYLLIMGHSYRQGLSVIEAAIMERDQEDVKVSAAAEAEAAATKGEVTVHVEPRQNKDMRRLSSGKDDERIVYCPLLENTPVRNDPRYRSLQAAFTVRFRQYKRKLSTEAIQDNDISNKNSDYILSKSAIGYYYLYLCFSLNFVYRCLCIDVTNDKLLAPYAITSLDEVLCHPLLCMLGTDRDPSYRNHKEQKKKPFFFEDLTATTTSENSFLTGEEFNDCYSQTFKETDSVFFSAISAHTNTALLVHTTTSSSTGATFGTAMTQCLTLCYSSDPDTLVSVINESHSAIATFHMFAGSGPLYVRYFRNQFLNSNATFYRNTVPFVVKRIDETINSIDDSKRKCEKNDINNIIIQSHNEDDNKRSASIKWAFNPVLGPLQRLGLLFSKFISSKTNNGDQNKALSPSFIENRSLTPLPPFTSPILPQILPRGVGIDVFTGTFIVQDAQRVEMTVSEDFFQILALAAVLDLTFEYFNDQFLGEKKSKGAEQRGNKRKYFISLTEAEGTVNREQDDFYSVVRRLQTWAVNAFPDVAYYFMQMYSSDVSKIDTLVGIKESKNTANCMTASPFKNFITNVIVRDCTGCSLSFLVPFATVTVTNVSNCRIFFGPCESAVLANISLCYPIAIIARTLNLEEDIEDSVISVHVVENPTCTSVDLRALYDRMRDTTNPERGFGGSYDVVNSPGERSRSFSSSEGRDLIGSGQDRLQGVQFIPYVVAYEGLSRHCAFLHLVPEGNGTRLDYPGMDVMHDRTMYYFDLSHTFYSVITGETTAVSFDSDGGQAAGTFEKGKCPIAFGSSVATICDYYKRRDARRSYNFTIEQTPEDKNNDQIRVKSMYEESLQMNDMNNLFHIPLSTRVNLLDYWVSFSSLGVTVFNVLDRMINSLSMGPEEQKKQSKTPFSQQDYYCYSYRGHCVWFRDLPDYPFVPSLLHSMTFRHGNCGGDFTLLSGDATNWCIELFNIHGEEQQHGESTEVKRNIDIEKNKIKKNSTVDFHQQNQQDFLSLLSADPNYAINGFASLIPDYSERDQTGGFYRYLHDTILSTGTMGLEDEMKCNSINNTLIEEILKDSAHFNSTYAVNAIMRGHCSYAVNSQAKSDHSQFIPAYPIITILEVVDTVSIRNVTKATIILAASASTVTLADVRDAQLFLISAHAVIVKNCHNIEIHGYSKTQGCIVSDDSDGVRLAPLLLKAPMLETILEVAGISVPIEQDDECSNEEREEDSSQVGFLIPENMFVADASGFHVLLQERKVVVISAEPTCVFEYVIPSHLKAASPVMLDAYYRQMAERIPDEVGTNNNVNNNRHSPWRTLHPQLEVRPLPIYFENGKNDKTTISVPRLQNNLSMGNAGVRQAEEFFCCSIHSLTDCYVLRTPTAFSPLRIPEKASSFFSKNKTLSIAHINGGVIHIVEAVKLLAISHCQGPLSIIVPAATYVIINDCVDLTLRVACVKFIVSNCHYCHFALHVNYEPMVDDGHCWLEELSFECAKLSSLSTSSSSMLLGNVNEKNNNNTNNSTHMTDEKQKEMSENMKKNIIQILSQLSIRFATEASMKPHFSTFLKFSSFNATCNGIKELLMESHVDLSLNMCDNPVYIRTLMPYPLRFLLESMRASKTAISTINFGEKQLKNDVSPTSPPFVTQISIPTLNLTEIEPFIRPVCFFDNSSSLTCFALRCVHKELLIQLSLMKNNQEIDSADHKRLQKLFERIFGRNINDNKAGYGGLVDCMGTECSFESFLRILDVVTLEKQNICEQRRNATTLCYLTNEDYFDVISEQVMPSFRFGLMWGPPLKPVVIGVGDDVPFIENFVFRQKQDKRLFDLLARLLTKTRCHMEGPCVEGKRARSYHQHPIDFNKRNNNVPSSNNHSVLDKESKAVSFYEFDDFTDIYKDMLLRDIDVFEELRRLSVLLFVYNREKMPHLTAVVTDISDSHVAKGLKDTTKRYNDASRCYFALGFKVYLSRMDETTMQKYTSATQHQITADVDEAERLETEGLFSLSREAFSKTKENEFDDEDNRRLATNQSGTFHNNLYLNSSREPKKQQISDDRYQHFHSEIIENDHFQSEKSGLEAFSLSSCQPGNSERTFTEDDEGQLLYFQQLSASNIPRTTIPDNNQEKRPYNPTEIPLPMENENIVPQKDDNSSHKKDIISKEEDMDTKQSNVSADTVLMARLKRLIEENRKQETELTELQNLVRRRLQSLLVF